MKHFLLVNIIFGKYNNNITVPSTQIHCLSLKHTCPRRTGAGLERANFQTSRLIVAFLKAR